MAYPELQPSSVHNRNFLHKKRKEAIFVRFAFHTRTRTRRITVAASISNHRGSNYIYMWSNRRRTGEVESSIIQETGACSFAPPWPGHGGTMAGGASALCGLRPWLGFNYALAVRTTASIDIARSYDAGGTGRRRLGKTHRSITSGVFGAAPARQPETPTGDGGRTPILAGILVFSYRSSYLLKTCVLTAQILSIYLWVICCISVRESWLRVGDFVQQSRQPLASIH
jgi:hypothetical protein